MTDRLRVLPGLRVPRSEPRPPRRRRLAVLYPTGPKELRLAQPVRLVHGPGDPPPGFIRPTTSKSEWAGYWALSRIFNDPVDPRRPPFFGGRDWGYQIAYLGQFAFQQGSAILDFIVYTAQQRVGIRLVTRYWHIAQSPQVKANDLIQRVRLEGQGNLRVADVYEDDIIGDPSGQAAVLAFKRAIGLWEAIDPFGSARSLAKG